MRGWADGVGVLGWLFDMGAADYWLFRLQRVDGILAIFHFDDLFRKKACEWCCRARVSKSNMVLFPAQVLPLWLSRSYIPGERFGVPFVNMVCAEGEFNGFGFVVDILDWRPRHNLARDCNSKVFFFFYYFFTDTSHSM